jgi:hypothetical protein
MPVVFEGCRLRVDRAHANGKALANAWNEIPAEDLYTVRVQVNPDGTGSFRLTRPKPVPTIFALQLGEMLYQLRAALDAAVYKAAVLDTGQDPPPSEQNLEFPIFHSPSVYAKKSALKIKPLALKRQKLIEAVQPYNMPDLKPEQMVFNGHISLGILNDWARKDRHRRLHIVGSWVSKANPQILCPPGVQVASLELVHSGFLEDDNEIATFQLLGRWRGMGIKATANLATEVAVNEAPPPCAPNDNLGNRLAGILAAVSHVIAMLEESF